MKWFHIIGVCGVATSRIARMFKDMGWFVTGSDNQYFSPAKDYLEDNTINTIEGFNFKHLTKEFWEHRLNVNLKTENNVPNLVLFQERLSLKNKEFLFAKNKGLDVRPYSKIFTEFLVKPESIVVAGTAGKTTTTSLITHILKELNLNPSYMIGGTPVGFNDSLENTDSDFSVLEGDEYHNPEINKPKFMEYKPKYVVITSLGYEHQDIYKTEEEYVQAFKDLVSTVPEDGFVVCNQGSKYKVENSKTRFITFSDDKQSGANFYYQYTQGVSENIPNKVDIFTIQGEKIISISTRLIGEYNIQNVVSAFLLVKHIKRINELITSDLFSNKLESIIERFKGVQKRLQILHKSENVVIIDDFGVTPGRARNSINTVFNEFEFREHKIIAVYEPNSGSRVGTIKENYKSVFDNADKIFIPTLSAFDPKLVTSEGLVKVLQELGNTSEVVKNDMIKDRLKKEISDYVSKGEKIVVVFFSSYRLTDIAHLVAHEAK